MCYRYKDQRKTFLEVCLEILGQELSIHYVSMKGRHQNVPFNSVNVLILFQFPYKQVNVGI